MPAQHEVMKRAVGLLDRAIAMRRKVFFDVFNQMLAHGGFVLAYEPALSRAGSHRRQNL